MKLFKDVSHTIVDDRWRSGIYSHIQTEFMKSFTGLHFYGKQIKIETKHSSLELVRIIREYSSKYIKTVMETAFYHMNHVVFRAENLLMFLHFTDSLESDYDFFPNFVSEETPIAPKKITEVSLEIYGEENSVVHLINHFNKEFSDETFTKISWFYKDTHGVDSHGLYIEQENDIHDEFYPWLDKGVEKFIDSYLKSPASVLVLYGPPGTGKTSFLKHMLCSRKLSAVVSYDEEVLNDDRFFIDFLTMSEYDIMIIEDADTLLSSRENDHNKIMNKFLNVSDGMVKVLNKKMVFTTNLSQLNKVDQALLRKGRCFAAVEFRNLTSAEAPKVSDKLGLPQMNWSSKDHWSLAEVCNQETVPAASQPVRKIGF